MGSNTTGAGHIFRHMAAQQAAELDRILAANDMSMLELFHAVAIGCEDLIMFCEDHRKFYISQIVAPTNESESCCQRFFNTTPIFSLAGTCYTTNTPILETFPASFNMFKVWADLTDTITPST